MGDTLTVVIAIVLAATLMFIFPLMSMSDRVDDTAQLTVQSATTQFVDDIRTTGKITKEKYDKFIEKITNPNTYDVEIEIQVLDENPGSKTTLSNSKVIGENVYYSVYTSQVENTLYRGSGEYILKEGDIVSVSVKNTNETISQQLSSSANSDISTIAAESSGMVTANGN